MATQEAEENGNGQLEAIPELGDFLVGEDKASDEEATTPEAEKKADSDKGEEKEAEVSPDVIALRTEFNSLKGKLSEQDRHILELRTENELLKQKSQPAQVSDDEIETALNADLTKNPAKAIQRLVDAKVKAALEEAKSHTTQYTAAQIQEQQQFEADRTRTLNEFGGLINQFPELGQLANQIYQEQYSNWTPGAMYSAVAQAHSKLVREGKLQPAIERRPRPKPQLFSSEDKATEIEDDPFKGYSAVELSRVERTMKQMGVTKEQWVKEMKNQRRKDSRFGDF